MSPFQGVTPLQPVASTMPKVKGPRHRTGKQRETTLRVVPCAGRLLALCHLPILTYFAYKLD
jgi:hypothetical protein